MAGLAVLTALTQCAAPVQMEPMFREMVEEVGRGGYVPVTSFGAQCEEQGQPAEAAAALDEA